MRANWTKIKTGKVRDVWRSRNDLCVALHASDRVSANDEVLDIIIPGKGKLLTKMSAKWFELTENVVPNALLTADVAEMPGCFRNSWFAERTTEMIALDMIPIEAVVRGYNAGSMWERYHDGERKFGNSRMPDGLLESMELPVPVYTPTTKAPAGEHDSEIDFNETVSIIKQMGVHNAREIAVQMRDYSLRLYAFCRDFAKRSGIILADTKFEFGIDENGVLRLADEVCTPDSSRFWLASDYKVGHRQNTLSTFIIRDWVKQEKSKGNTQFQVPEELIRETQDAYEVLFNRLFGQQLATS